jgi:hypothetical protein
MLVAALVDDLLDRSRLAAALPATTFLTDPGGLGPVDVVVVDLARHAADLALVRGARPEARIVAFGPHVDADALRAARAAGADRVLARSAFFRDPAAAIAAGSDGASEGRPARGAAAAS